MNNNVGEAMAVWHPEGMDCLSWEEEVKRETEEVLQEVTGQAEQEQGLKSEDPDLDGSVDPYDSTNLEFDVDEEGNLCPSDASSDGSLLDLGVSLLPLISSLDYPSASQDMEAYYNGGGGDLYAPLDIAAPESGDEGGLPVGDGELGDGCGDQVLVKPDPDPVVERAPLPVLVREVKEEVMEEPLCVASEPEGTYSPPPSPPRRPGKARANALVVKLKFKVCGSILSLLDSVFMFILFSVQGS